MRRLHARQSQACDRLLVKVLTMLGSQSMWHQVIFWKNTYTGCLIIIIIIFFPLHLIKE